MKLLGGVLGRLRRSWAVLEAILDRLGSMFGRLGGILGRLGGALEASWAVSRVRGGRRRWQRAADVGVPSGCAWAYLKAEAGLFCLPS